MSIDPPADPPRPPKAAPRASGAIICALLVLGTGVGVAMRQPTLGLLGGLALGIAIAVILWRRDERR